MRVGSRMLGLVTMVALVAAACGPKEAAPTQPPAGPEERGRQLAQAQGCLGCHSTTGETLVGPTWKGLYGHSVRLTDGSTATVDDAYLTESILNPNIRVVQGFPAGTMPSYQGVLTQSQIEDIIAYIKTLR